jgi:hypothetical protein
VEYVLGYDAETGKELWRLKGTSMISVPTPFTANPSSSQQWVEAG